jgi:hypothetical protein
MVASPVVVCALTSWKKLWRSMGPKSVNVPVRPSPTVMTAYMISVDAAMVRVSMLRKSSLRRPIHSW